MSAATAAGRRHPDLLSDRDLEQAIRADGYAMCDLLSDTEVEAFRDAYHRHAPAETGGFRPSYAVWEPERKRATATEVMPLWQPVLDRLFGERQAFMTSYLPKHPGEGSELPLHQDWNYVDESEHRSVVVWVALDDVDTDLDNGPLYVLPGSHLMALERRGTLTAPWYSADVEQIMERSVAVAARSGQAVIMDNRLLHFSTPNRGESLRLAVAVAVTSPEAKLQHATATGDGRVYIHQVDADFFLDRSPEDLKANPLDSSTAVDEGPMVVVPPDPEAIAERWGIVVTPSPVDDAPSTSDAQPASEALAADHSTPAPPAADGSPILDRLAVSARRVLNRVRNRSN